MLNQTTVLIVTLVLAAIAALIVLVNVLKNRKRSLLRGLMSLLVALVCIPIAILLAQSVGSLCVAVAMNFLDAETLQMITGALPSAAEAAGALVKMLVAPLLIVPIYLIVRLIIALIVGAVVTHWEKEGTGPLARKNGAIGAAIGAVCGLVLVVVVMTPLAGYTAMADEVLDTGILSTMDSNGVVTPILPEAEQAALDDMLNTPVLSITRSLGGKAIFNGLTSARVAGERVTLTREVSAICGIAKTGMSVWNQGIDQLDIEELAALGEQLPTVFENSTLLRVLGAEAISGMSNAWLQNESFMGASRPDFDNSMINVVVDSALGLFCDTTKDTIVDDVRGLTPLFSIAATATQLGNGAELTDLLDALAEHADSPEIKYLLLNAGVGILAEELGLYNNKEEIYDEYISALALLSSGSLAEDELCAAIKDLNDMYAIPMSDAECAALASSLIAHPYAGEGDPSLALPTTTYPTFSMLASTGTPTVTLLGETDAYAAWLAQLFEAVPETEKEALAWIASEDKATIPSQLMTGEELASLVSKETAAELGKEQMTALLTAASQIISGAGSDEGFNLEETMEAVGTALGSLTSTESGKALVSGLVTGVLQSEKAQEALGVTPSQATTIANSIKDNGVENLGQTVKDVGQLMNVVTHLKDGNTDSAEQLSPDDFRTLLMTMNDSSAALLRSLCTADMLQKSGLPAESAAGIAHLMDDLLAELVVARKNWSDEAYQKEADALYRVLLLALGAKNATGSTFEERIGMSPEQLIELIQASELLTTVLPDSIDELYRDNPDALGLSAKLDADDRAQLLTKIEEYKQTADDGGDALLDALARMLGQ